MSNRIDRIDGNKYYEYTKIKNLNVSDADEKFSLDYKQDGMQAEKEKKKDNAEEGQERKQPEPHQGVRVDISNSARMNAAAAKKAQANTLEKSLFTTSPLEILTSIKEFVNTAIAAVKDFFYKIWNDPQPEVLDNAIEKKESSLLEITGQAGAIEQDFLPISQPEIQYESERDYRMQEALLDREIQPYLRRGDLNQVISLLTDNGKREAARNSTLLTYYDRTGRMVEPNASDRERILHGDRNTRKL